MDEEPVCMNPKCELLTGIAFFVWAWALVRWVELGSALSAYSSRQHGTADVGGARIYLPVHLL